MTDRNWRLSMPTPAVYWADKVIYDLHHKPGDLVRYREDADAYLSAYNLTPQMRRLILEIDVAGLYLAGINPYLLRAHCIGMGVPEHVSVGALRSIRDEAHG